jgi:uncharacterized protein (UPF0276 family)
VPGASASVAPPAVPALGVGLLYNPALPPFLETDLDAVDYLEVIPDMFWTDGGPDAQPRYVEIESWMEVLEAVAAERPIVAHNIGFSLASADSFEAAYLEQIARWEQRFGFRWQSDHLAFGRVSSPDGHEHQAGLGVPVPYDHELLDLLAGRIEAVQSGLSVPFLIENNVYFVEFPEQEMSEPEFLNALTERTGCGLLLDLHNLYVNARNHGFDAFEFVDELNLARVLEIHIAGGSELAGMYTDSHAGPCPEPVWDLLDTAVPRAQNLAGITFEFHDSYYPLLGREGTRRELERARGVFGRRRVA